MNADALAELRGLAMPDAISWWPMAVGWWILLALLLVLITVAVIGIRRWRAKQRWRNLAYHEYQAILSQYRAGASKDQVLMQVSMLFRQISLVLLPREEVASLSGQEWLVTLNTLGDTSDFTQGAGQVLADSLWQKPEHQDDVNMDALLDLQKRFIRKARVLV